MRTRYWIVSMAAGSAALLAGPATTFAASAAADAELTEEALIDVIESDAANPAMIDGRGGGGYGIVAPYMNGVQVDASVTKEVTPDFIALNAYCDSGKRSNREDAKAALDQVFTDIKNAVGSDGRVRKQGGVSVYPFYGQNGEDTGSYTGSMSIFIRIVNPSAAQRISDYVENKGCGVNWDVRLVDTQSFEMDNLDELMTRLEKRKQVFEKLLGKKLNTVSSAAINTWADGYSSYDPTTNKVDATTTLSVSYSLSGRTTVTPTTRVPRG